METKSLNLRRHVPLYVYRPRQSSVDFGKKGTPGQAAQTPDYCHMLKLGTRTSASSKSVLVAPAQRKCAMKISRPQYAEITKRKQKESVHCAGIQSQIPFEIHSKGQALLLVAINRPISK